MPLVLIVMGVGGCGKTTIGQLLSAALDCSFIDADNFHPAANVRKMETGNPLTDEDRLPWLEILAEKVREHIRQEQPMVLGCSALKKAYRQVLCVEPKYVQFIYLRGDYDTIAQRLQARENHFMKATLLQSQFAALEEPEKAIVVDINPSPSEILATIQQSLCSGLNKPK
jgi:gluconokinase